MRTVALFYIILSVGANFFIGSLTTFVLAALSFPFLIWLLAKTNSNTGVREAPQSSETAANNPGVS